MFDTPEYCACIIGALVGFYGFATLKQVVRNGVLFCFHGDEPNGAVGRGGLEELWISIPSRRLIIRSGQRRRGTTANGSGMGD